MPWPTNDKTQGKRRVDLIDSRDWFGPGGRRAG
jgi:hypothetical protein